MQNEGLQIAHLDRVVLLAIGILPAVRPARSSFLVPHVAQSAGPRRLFRTVVPPLTSSMSTASEISEACRIGSGSGGWAASHEAGSAEWDVLSIGNVGKADSEGPAFFNALASSLGGTSCLAIQGVTYPASVLGFLAGGAPAGATTMVNLINQAASRCPSTKIIVSGYGQGAQLVHTATQRLSATNAG
jgi:hypothetical protein